MNQILFSSLYVSNLTISGLYSLIKSTIEQAKPHLSEIGPLATAILSQVEFSQENLGASMNKSQKSALTSVLKELDKSRDGDIAEINSVTATYLRSKNESKKAAASALHLFLAPYKGVASQPINIETATIADMLTKYMARPELMAAAQTLDINNLFTSLETKNSELNTVYQSRNTEYAERDIAASDVKPAAVMAYTQFCTTIELTCTYTPNDTLLALFNQMDEIRKKYHALEGKEVTASSDVAASN